MITQHDRQLLESIYAVVFLWDRKRYSKLFQPNIHGEHEKKKKIITILFIYQKNIIFEIIRLMHVRPDPILFF